MATSSQQIAIELLAAEFIDDASTSIQAACKRSPKRICTCLHSVYTSGVYVNFLTTPSERIDKTVWGNIDNDMLYDNFTKHYLSSNLLAQ
eukprot:805919-Ditylum_brightwellii.AAC.1